MPPLLKFILRRLFFMVASFLVITALLYAGIMLTPVEERVMLYMPKNLSPRVKRERHAPFREQSGRPMFERRPERTDADRYGRQLPAFRH